MDEFVLMPIRKEYVDDVIAFVAKLGGKSADIPQVGAKGGEFWPVEDLRTLRDSPRSSVKYVAQMLDILSAKPDTPVAFSAIAKALGITREQLQGQVGGFSRWIRAEWPGEDPAWPFSYENTTAADPGLTTETFYTINLATANLWKRVRGEK